MLTKDLGHRALCSGDGDVPYMVFLLSGLEKVQDDISKSLDHL